MFREYLKSVIDQVPGSHAALIMGYDGIPLEEYANPQLPKIDLQTLGVEYSGLVNEIKKNASNLGLGGIQEVTVRSDSFTFVIRLINAEYFMILALGEHAYFGKGRYLLRSISSQVKSQL